MIYRGDPAQWSVRVTNITKSYKAKRFLGEYIYVEGEANGTSDFDRVQFTFQYTGRSNEDPQKMLDFLKQRAVDVSWERMRAHRIDTLEEFVQKRYQGGES